MNMSEPPNQTPLGLPSSFRSFILLSALSFFSLPLSSGFFFPLPTLGLSCFPPASGLFLLLLAQGFSRFLPLGSKIFRTLKKMAGSQPRG